MCGFFQACPRIVRYGRLFSTFVEQRVYFALNIATIDYAVILIVPSNNWTWEKTIAFEKAS